MPSGGDTFNKYGTKRRIDGKLCLDNLVHDTACRLLAEDTSAADIPTLLNNEITVGEIEQGLSNWQWQRRISYIKKTLDKENRMPETPDDCLKFVKENLVHLSKTAEADDKMKIEALKALASVAIDERKNKPQETKSEATTPAMERLLKGPTND